MRRGRGRGRSGGWGEGLGRCGGGWDGLVESADDWGFLRGEDSGSHPAGGDVALAMWRGGVGAGGFGGEMRDGRIVGPGGVLCEGTNLPWIHGGARQGWVKEGLRTTRMVEGIGLFITGCEGSFRCITSSAVLSREHLPSPIGLSQLPTRISIARS